MGSKEQVEMGKLFFYSPLGTQYSAFDFVLALLKAGVQCVIIPAYMTDMLPDLNIILVSLGGAWTEIQSITLVTIHLGCF